jgi:Capsular polysaccharide synthesis protein
LTNEGRAKRVIWQYWETRGTKPAFIDGLSQIARKNAGVEIVLVTPETLHAYLPDLPPEILQIQEMAHKADMIRAMLVLRHGGMWLDSDAIVLQDLSWLFEYLDDVEFVGFNDHGRLRSGKPWVRVNCFLARPNSRVMAAWVAGQHAKFPNTVYAWEEIGSALLHPICLEHRNRVKILPFERICPIRWDEVEKFLEQKSRLGRAISKCYIVMLSNKSLGERAAELQKRTVEEIVAGDSLLSAILRRALTPPDTPPLLERLREAATGLFGRPSRTRADGALSR